MEVRFFELASGIDEVRIKSRRHNATGCSADRQAQTEPAAPSTRQSKFTLAGASQFRGLTRNITAAASCLSNVPLESLSVPCLA